MIATDRLLGDNDDHEDEDLIDPERLTYFQVVDININIVQARTLWSDEDN